MRRGTVVIGLGNPIMGDDGIGIAALERLRDTWDVPDDVELVDGGTWGLTLLPIIEDAGAVLLIDAIDTGSAPGTDAVILRDQLPKHLATKVSPHQVDLQDVLALAELRGTLPDRTVAIGLQPAIVEMTSGLSDALRARVDHLVLLVVGMLESWGHRCTAKPEPARA
ncbi:MAG TPA: HyaD/HybD family hydrogenase maturation endopeptidase [Gemmatimonadales bacterium]|nr:HyaD/HybD family hydrogenase maturation endopeptidase [Gemmatimonadales bacterium]